MQAIRDPQPTEITYSHCFIAGHHRSGKLELNWNELAQPNQTLVFYMGLNGLETICEQLKRFWHGSNMLT